MKSILLELLFLIANTGFAIEGFIRVSNGNDHIVTCMVLALNLIAAILLLTKVVYRCTKE